MFNQIGVSEPKGRKCKSTTFEERVFFVYNVYHSTLCRYHMLLELGIGVCFIQDMYFDYPHSGFCYVAVTTFCQIQGPVYFLMKTPQ